jgi:hypothetical protein
VRNLDIFPYYILNLKSIKKFPLGRGGGAAGADGVVVPLSSKKWNIQHQD